MSINESRNLLGLEPVEGWDKRLQSLNYVATTKANLYQVVEKDEDTCQNKIIAYFYDVIKIVFAYFPV